MKCIIKNAMKFANYVMERNQIIAMIVSKIKIDF